MGSRRERCGYCGKELLVSLEAQAIRCPICRGTTMIKPVTLAQPWEPRINHAPERTGLPPPPAGNYHMSMSGGGGGYSSWPMGGTAMGGGGGYNYGYNYHQVPQKPMWSPSAYGMKRAVLCGVSYRGKNYRIKGSINDVRCMRYFLSDKFGFPADSILMLTEDEMDPKKMPTKENIRAALRWLVEGCEPGDSLVFYFSGHGTKLRDYDMDEADGFDEALCPLDFDTEGPIIDDEINHTIVRPIPKGAKLHAIVDACYSGTVLDLPYVCRMNREGYYMWEDQNSRVYKNTSGGVALSFSACGDDQTCLETTAMTGTTSSTGALTYSFIQTVQNEPGLTYGRLLGTMRNVIRSAKSGGLRLNGPLASMLNKAFFNFDISQEPQLSSSEKFDLYSKQFAL